ncbi:MAG TPA: cell division protein ZapA [Caldithrix abyssi]|uniref:Cell division protein ZapA n=1 Tax=Caldithrix abyssi TaxID=187145 RepID=A0A7V4U3F7_CALAY|nr:cell division protein ZapA [Caldithrix abyssi]
MASGQIKVNIFGTEYSLIADNDEHYVQRVAQYIDEKMREIDRKNDIKSTGKLAVLAALNIVDELFQERQYRKKLLDQINEEARKLNHSITEVLEE